MGGLCSCCEDSKTSEPTIVTPLLGGLSSKPVTSQHVPSYANSSVPQAPARDDSTPRSARQHRPNDLKEQDFLTSLDEVAVVSLHTLPSQLTALNKTFQDHAKLYNDQHDNFVSLREALNNFKGKFVKETQGIPVMSACIAELGKKCGGAQLTAQRGKHCVLLEFDPREVSEKCQGLPEDVLQALELYNKINRQVKSIREKLPQVKVSLALVLEDEHELKKEVTKSDLSSAEGPEVARMCLENINRLRKLHSFMDTIQKYTDKIFHEIVEGSKVLELKDGSPKKKS